MVYDAADGYVVLFTTYLWSGSPGGQTWKFSHGHWANITKAHHPSSRWYTSMAYDAADRYIVLFGGWHNLGNGLIGALNDTWKFQNGTWTRLSPSQAPSARAGATMSYDPDLRAVVLFGGGALNAYPTHETWEFANGSWTQLHPRGWPAGMFSNFANNMVFDAKDHSLLLFRNGGQNIHGGYTNATWLLSNGTWTRLIPIGPSPQGRIGASLAYDSARNRVILFGGALPSHTGWRGSNATWSFSGGKWALLSPLVSPSARDGAQMCYDPGSPGVFLYGGGSTGLLGDTWILP